MEPASLCVDFGEHNLFPVRIDEDCAADVLAYEENIQKLLVEPMEMELAVALLRSVDHKHVAAQHCRETVGNTFNGVHYVPVHIQAKIIGIFCFAHKAVADFNQKRRGGVAQLCNSAQGS